MSGKFEHIEPLNEDGSPLYAFGRRTIPVSPAFSTLAHLTTNDFKFVKFLSSSPESNIKEKKPKTADLDGAMGDKGPDDIPGGGDSTCMKEGCRQVAKNILNANVRLADERDDLNAELEDIMFDVADVESQLDELEESLTRLQSNNSDLDAELTQLKEHEEKLNEERIMRDKEKTDLANKIMIAEADRQRWTRRKKEVAQKLSNLLWKGRAELDDGAADNNIDLGNLTVKLSDQKSQDDDANTVATSYYNLARDDCLDFTDRSNYIVNRKIEQKKLMQSGLISPSASFDRNNSMYQNSIMGSRSRLSSGVSATGGGLVNPGVSAGNSNMSPVMGSLMEMSTFGASATGTLNGSMIEGKLTTTSSVMPISATIAVHPVHKRPLTPSRSVKANNYDGSPASVGFYTGPVKNTPFPYLNKGTGVPFYNPAVCSPGSLRKFRGPPVPGLEGEIGMDDNRSYNSEASLSTLNTNMDDEGPPSEITDADIMQPYRRLDPVFYNEKSRRSFGRRNKPGMVRLRESTAKEDKNNSSGYSRMLTSTAHPGVFSGLTKSPVRVTDMNREEFEKSTKFNALGDVDKISLSLDNMAELDFQAPPKSPMSATSGGASRASSRMGSRRSRR